jgi:dephospho-CoA kinase
MEPAMPRSTPIIGLLGGPGSGKSFVARLFAEEGCGIIDADRIAREALQRPEVKRQLVDWWGEDVLDAEGNVDRAAVGKIAFGDADELRRLESVVHPKVHEKREQMRSEMREDPMIRAIVEDCPLLIESELDKGCDALVFVEAPRSVRLERVQRHRGWEEAELDRREQKQLPLDTKRERADYVVDNAQDEAEVHRSVRRVLSTILRDR